MKPARELRVRGARIDRAGVRFHIFLQILRDNAYSIVVDSAKGIGGGGWHLPSWRAKYDLRCSVLGSLIGELQGLRALFLGLGSSCLTACGMIQGVLTDL